MPDFGSTDPLTARFYPWQLEPVVSCSRIAGLATAVGTITTARGLSFLSKA